MNNDLLELLIKKIKTHELPEGGFPSKPEGSYRPDAKILQLHSEGWNSLYLGTAPNMAREPD